jgi:translation initiation factor IF-3
LRVNDEIRVREVRLIDADGTQLGVVDIQKAREVAESRDLDLVEVSPTAKPPVCKVLDFGKYRFEQSKRIKESRKTQKVVIIKEIRLRPKIEEHDYNTKLKQTIGFLNKGYKVKISIRFRGREMAHTDIGRNILERIIQDISEIGEPEFSPKFEGRVIVTVLSPAKKKK